MRTCHFCSCNEIANLRFTAQETAMSFDSSPSPFDTVIQRSTDCMKWGAQSWQLTPAQAVADPLPMWVADMDFASPPAVLDALQQELDNGILGYPYIKGIKESFISFAQKRHSITIDSSHVAIASGMLSSIAILIELYSQEGDSIILPFPSYHPFVDIINNLNRKILPWPLSYDEKEHSFSLDFPLLHKITEENNPPILLFCSPHNPTGIVFSEDELNKVALLAKKNNMLIISDEIHADLVFKHEKHIPFSAIASTYNIHCATCMAPSKTFNIAGEHFSIVVFNDIEMKTTFANRLKAIQSSPDVLAAVASKAAYDGAYNWLISLVDYLEENSKIIEQVLTKYESSIVFIRPKASFIGLFDCKILYNAVVKDSEEHPLVYASRGDGGLLSRFFGQKAGIAMNDGSWFGSDYHQFVRFNFAAPKEVVKDAMEKICEAEKALLTEYSL